VTYGITGLRDFGFPNRNTAMPKHRNANSDLYRM
jgi:hypothetical protein